MRRGERLEVDRRECGPMKNYILQQERLDQGNKTVEKRLKIQLERGTVFKFDPSFS